MSAKKKKKEPAPPMNKVLAAVSRDLGAPWMYRHMLLTAAWRKIVGEKLKEKTRPGKIADGCLTIYVSDASWAHELTYLRDDLLEKINREIPGRKLTDLRFVPGLSRSINVKTRRKANIKDIQIDDELVESSMNLNALKGKPALKKAFREFIASSYRLRKYLDEQP